MDWTDAQISIIREFAGKIEAANIALKINAATGSTYTRNAIIGKMRRLGLAGLPRPKKVPRVRLSRVRKPPRVSFEPPAVEAESLNISFLDLAFGHCRFPTSGEGLESLFCGHTTGSSYCRWHQLVAYQPRYARSNSDAPESGRPGISTQA